MAAQEVIPSRQGVTEQAELEGMAKRVPKGSLLMSFKLTIGRVGFAAVDLFPNEAIAWVRPTQADLDARYLAYWLGHLDLEEYASRAVKGKTLNRSSLNAIPVLIPPLSTQRRMADLVGSVDRLAFTAELARRAARAARTALLHEVVEQPDQVRLGELATLDIQRVSVRTGETYRIAGVFNAGKGLFAREAIDGAATNYPVLHRLHSGQLVMRKLTAWEGTVAVVPPELDGYYVSTEFPTFTLDVTHLLPAYMQLVCQLPAFWEALKDRSTGTVQRRKRVNPHELLEIRIPLPKVSQQQDIVEIIGAIDQTAEAAGVVKDSSSQLQVSLLDDLLSREHEIPASYDRLLAAG